MTVREIIILGCQQESMNQRDLAEALELKNPGSVSNRIAKHDGMNMKVSTLLTWLYAVGGELVVQFPDHESEFVLDGESEGVDYEQNVNMIYE